MQTPENIPKPKRFARILLQLHPKSLNEEALTFYDEFDRYNN